MRVLEPLFFFLAVAAFHAVLSASLESAEKEEKLSQYDGLTKLQKIDQMEFEAAQKTKEAHINVTEEHTEGARYLEAVHDGSVEGHVEAKDASTEHSTSLESTEKEENLAQYDGLTKLQKIDQMEFEAAQKTKEAQFNVTEEHNEGTHYLEALQDGSVGGQGGSKADVTAEGAGTSDAAAHEESESASSEETPGRQ